MKKSRAYGTSLIASVVLVLFGAPAMAGITAEQKDLLNNHFSPSVAAKVQLGTLIDSADTVVSADITDDTIVVGDLNSTVMKEATGTLSQANIQAMNGAAVTLIAAPGAGKVIVVDEIEIFHDYATAAYTNGGDVTIEYETSGVDVLVFDVALVTAAADANYVWKVGDSQVAYTTTATAASATDLSTSANKALTITNATAAFAAGNASNIIKWRIRYHVVTLLT